MILLILDCGKSSTSNLCKEDNLKRRGEKKTFLWLSRWKGSQAFKTVSFLTIQSLSSGNLQRSTSSDTKSMTYFNIKNVFFKLVFCFQILSVSVTSQSKSCVFSRNLTGIKKLYYGWHIYRHTYRQVKFWNYSI